MNPNNSDKFTQIPKPPKIAERFLAFFLHQEDKEVVLGDFEEEYFLIACQSGVKYAKQWYYFEILKSMPFLYILKYNRLIRSQIMNKNNKLALLGTLLVLPAFLLVLGGVAQSGFGTTKINDALNFNLVLFHPVVILGGLIVAFGLNLLPILRINYQSGVLVSTLTIKDRVLNVFLVSCIGVLATAIFFYLLAENLQLFQLITPLQ